MITGTTLELPPTLASETFVQLFALACIQTRFDHPIIAVTIETGHLANPLLPSMLYRQGDYHAMEEWAKNAIVVHAPTEAEKHQSIQERTENMRQKLELLEIDVTRCAKVMHMVFGGRPDQVSILVHCAHAISDAHTEMLVLRKQLDYINTYSKAPFPLPHEHPSHPAQLPWGEEVKHLPPSLHELYGVDIAAFEPAKGLSTSGKMLNGHSLRLDLGRENGTGLCNTHHTTLLLNKEESSSIYRAAKSQGWTVTHAVDAARHMAYVEMRRDYLEKNRGKPVPETLHTNFLMPVDGRSRFVEPYRGKDFAGNATSGFVTILPLWEPYFVPASTERYTRFWRKQRDLSQVQVFCKLAKKLSQMYRDASKELIDTTEGITPLLMIGGLFGPDYPTAALAPEGFSSVGVLERILPREHFVAGHEKPIRVIDWFVGLTMSHHIFSLQFSFHMWSFRDQIHLSVIHTDHFSKEYTNRFLDCIKTTLLLFAEVYDPEAPPQPSFLENCTCM